MGECASKRDWMGECASRRDWLGVEQIRELNRFRQGKIGKGVDGRVGEWVGERKKAQISHGLLHQGV